MRADAIEWGLDADDYQTALEKGWECESRGAPYHRHLGDLTTKELPLHVLSAIASFGAAYALNRMWTALFHTWEEIQEHKCLDLDGAIVKASMLPHAGLIIEPKSNRPLDCMWIASVVDRKDPRHGWVVGWDYGTSVKVDLNWDCTLPVPAHIIRQWMLRPAATAVLHPSFGGKEPCRK